uniref:PSII 6.1 kDa protein n=1 Tax=Anthurium amnicola TaxID=1678845 RepID=A0A1D1XCN0_9ARAE
MASMAAAATMTTVAHTAIARKAVASFSSSPVLGLPQMGVRGGRVRCSTSEKKATPATVSMGATLLAAAVSVSSPALALVDERMTTEGTGLSLGVSNNLLGWILVGVFGLIWALFFVYTSSLEEDEESGLSL